jgi:hypothetical protein
VTGRDSIRGVEAAWASQRALLEPCPRCSHRAVLLPTHGRRGGERLCLACGEAERRGELRLIQSDDDRTYGLTLFDDDRGGGR